MLEAAALDTNYILRQVAKYPYNAEYRLLHSWLMYKTALGCRWDALIHGATKDTLNTWISLRLGSQQESTEQREEPLTLERMAKMSVDDVHALFDAIIPDRHANTIDQQAYNEQTNSNE